MVSPGADDPDLDAVLGVPSSESIKDVDVVLGVEEVDGTLSVDLERVLVHLDVDGTPLSSSPASVRCAGRWPGGVTRGD